MDAADAENKRGKREAAREGTSAYNNADQREVGTEQMYTVRLYCKSTENSRTRRAAPRRQLAIGTASSLEAERSEIEAGGAEPQSSE